MQLAPAIPSSTVLPTRSTTATKLDVLSLKVVPLHSLLFCNVVKEQSLSPLCTAIAAAAMHSMHNPRGQTAPY